MDWKAGHKNRCRRKGDSWKQRDEEEKHQPQECKVDVQTAQKAMLELQALLKEDHSLESLQAEYYKAQDEIEHLQKNQEQKIKSAVSGKSKQPDLTKDEVSTAYRNAVENRQHGKEKSTDKIKNHSEIETNSAANALTSNPRCNILLQNVNSSDLWDYWIEILSNICCYQIMLRPNAAHLKDMFGVSEVADELELSVTILDERQHTTSVVSLRRRGSRQEAKPNVIFCAMLPGKVSSTPRSFQVENTNIDGSGSLNLRLEYQSSLEQKSGELESSTSYSLSISSAKKLQCRFCQMNLLSSNTPIDRVVPMPSANWDDIADYLICYSGVSNSSICAFIHDGTRK